LNFIITQRVTEKAQRYTDKKILIFEATMSGLRINIARFLLLVFSIILSPKEFFHDLYGHEDTLCIPGSEHTLEPKHHHCAILQIEAPVFDTPPSTSIIPLELVQNSIALTATSSVVFTILFYFNLRAPPQI